MTQENILEKVSGKASESWPVFGKKYFFMDKYSWNLPGNSFRKIPWVTPQNWKIWKKFGKSFRDIPWVTARFLEIVPGIWLYGLTESPFSKKKLSLKKLAQTGPNDRPYCTYKTVHFRPDLKSIWSPATYLNRKYRKSHFLFQNIFWLESVLFSDIWFL